jgi:HEAT repeat protein
MTYKDRGAVPMLEDYLAHSTIEEVRARTADALWLIGDRSSVPALLAALGDPSLKVKGFAASGLGDLGDASAVDPLLALFATLADNKEETKARIADALGKLGDRRAAPAIKASLDSIRDPAYVRWARPALDRLTR